MSDQHKPPDTDFFWEIAESYLKRTAVDEGQLMGFPCLRVNDEFFCTCDHRSGDLIVKLPKERVIELVKEGVGEPFAPAGRVFKEWMAVSDRDTRLWITLMDEALEFVGGGK